MNPLAKLTFPAVAVTALLTACATAPETNDLLQQAEQAVEQAEQSTAVNQYEPVQLQKAQTTLDMAQRGWEEYGTSRDDEVNHLAYVARQQALVAIERAAAQQARDEIENASDRRTEMLLEAREQQVEQLQDEAEITRRDAEELRRNLQSLEAEETDRGVVLTMDQVLFEFDKAELKAGGVQAISRLADFLKGNPDRQVLIEGHTDAIGDEAYNRQLSQQRAEAVKQQLTEFGVEEERVQIRGYGEEFPVASNDTPAGRQQNRRVEIVVGTEPEFRTTAR